MTNLTDMLSKFVNSNTASTSGSGTLPSNTITNPKVDLKGITTRSGVAYQGPTIPTTSSPPKVVERETEVTKDTVPPTNNGSTKDVQPPVVQVQPHVPNSEPVVAPVSAPMPNLKPSIPYPSRRNDERRREKANDQIEKFYEIFKDLSFKISLTDALILMPKFASTLKALIGNKEKLTLADLGASINLMPLSVWEKFSSGAHSYLRSFLKTRRALIDVYKGELTLRVGKEAITFNLDQTSRYSSNYNDNSVNRIDVIEMACEEYSQEVLGFSDSMLTSALERYPTSRTEVDDSYYDPEGDILLLESFLNDDPSLPPPTQGNYLPEIQKELKVCEAKTDKSSIDEPPEVELKDLPPHLEYAFLEGDDKFPIIIAKDLSVEEKAALIKILMEEDYKPAVQHQRWVNPKIHDVIKKEVEKLLDAGLIYLISDSPWLNEATRKDHLYHYHYGIKAREIAERVLLFSLMVSRVTFKFPSTISTSYQKRPHSPLSDGTFAYRRMPFGLCNALGTFQRCMMAIFHDMIEKMMEVFMDDFSVFGNSFRNRLSRVDKILQGCEDTNLCLYWEKNHFMVKECIVLGHKISKNGIEVDKAKVDVIAKLPHPTTVKGVQSFLGHADFHRRFIKDFSKISRLMTHLLEKNTPFIFSNECIQAFETLKKKLTEAPILIAPDWDLPFELMCDASDFAKRWSWGNVMKNTLGLYTMLAKQ
ncbi:reverse transcriptase domain-containing protein [Tanacetum coccineum]